MKKGKDKKNRSLDTSSSPSSPNEKRNGNSPKRSRFEGNRSMSQIDKSPREDSSYMDCSILENVASQITIANTPSPVYGDIGKNNRLEFIKSQKKNRYTPSNHPPFLVHVESTDGNIGNVHPMRLGKTLTEHFPSIQNIKKLGRNIIVVNFKFSFDANQFAQANDSLPENWIAYIPNYKIIRTGIARGVDPSLSVDEILQGIKWRDRPMEIKSVERLSYRDSRNNNELKISSSIKIEFVSNLLPEYVNIWSVRTKVRPFVNRVRKCFNCLRWGHSSAFCRGSPLCPRCGGEHDLGMCLSDSFLCPDCGQNYVSFDNNCLIYVKYELNYDVRNEKSHDKNSCKYIKIEMVFNKITFAVDKTNL